ncbi:MAG: Flp pilus assembly complex ATPase component TadA [Planctomycetes bacterium]|nr:Flp pilus assembly complex ATPase component TadA [Planctomycetota bacterium]
MQASLTGHLVLSTLHTNDAPSAVTRLNNMDVESYLLAASLEVVLAQRLVRKLCSECREPANPTGSARERLKELGFDVEKLYASKGCPRCRSSGYSGRIGIFELFCIDDEIRDLIVGGADLQALRKAARQHGVRSLFEDGVAKASQGITSADEVLRVTV